VSRLTLRPPRGNRRVRTPLRERLPAPKQVVDACGRALRRAAPAIGIAAVIAGVAGAGYAGYRWLTTSPRFAVATVEVHGEAALTEDEIRSRLPFALGDNIFRLDTDAAEAALAAEPWIATVAVRRKLPRTVVVDVTERRPAAVISADGLYLADASGAPFKRVDLARGEGRDLPVISGINRELFAAAPTEATARTRAGLAVLAAWGQTRPKAGEVRVEPSGTTLYTYDDAIAVRLGAADPAALPGPPGPLRRGVGRAVARRAPPPARPAPRQRRPPRPRHRLVRLIREDPSTPWPRPRLPRSSSASTSAPPRSRRSPAR
jgi:cell division septal protein FtsQ